MSHHDYPAADMFPRTGCGTTVMAPTSGTIIQTRPVNRYPGSHDNPAWRGGITVDMLGDDGVRFHLAHLSSIHAGIVSGVRVDVGQALGTVGRTGRASVCHLHLGISPPCPQLEWSVRRGVVWPQRYLTAWKHGIALDPATEVSRWAARHPSACTVAAAQAHAVDS
jgi:murein DD-endopeptidase MepM/ murein hydrolase activator NlpD